MVVKIFRDKASVAMNQHGNTHMQGEKLNCWFKGDPEKFVDAFADSQFIVKGDPKGSRFMNHLVTFKGPMYRKYRRLYYILVSSLAPMTGHSAFRPPLSCF